jgi:glycolate oxidase FAD binding subunit
MTTTTNITEQLAAITDPEHVRPGNPITVSPANTQQVSDVLRYANENHLKLTPTGGGTKQSWGNPTQTQIRLGLTRLNRVLEHPWQDLTCTVQAGSTWQQLQQTLAKHGQFVALDPLWPERATVGGILATNDSGALRHRYGSLRDLVIGMTLVLADGTIARSGGRVVKNVAGYDLCKLLTGSFGTLAIITEATFRLHPLPQHTQTFTVSAPQAAQLAPLMASIRASHLLTQALQLRGDSYGFHLDIQLNAHPEARQNEILQRMAESAGLKLDQPLASSTHTPQNATEKLLASASHIAPLRDSGRSSGLQAAEKEAQNKRGFSPGQSDDIWLAREKHFEDDDSFTVKMTMLPVNVPDFSEHVVRVGGLCTVQSNGIMLASFRAPTHTTAYAIAELRKEIEKKGGSLVVLKYAALTWSDLERSGTSSNTLPLMQAVKHQFDPNRTLNPGRFLGGI